MVWKKWSLVVCISLCGILSQNSYADNINQVNIPLDIQHVNFVYEVLSSNEISFQTFGEDIPLHSIAYLFSKKDSSFITSIEIESKTGPNIYTGKSQGEPLGFLAKGDFVVLEKDMKNFDHIQANAILMFENNIDNIKYQPLFYIPSIELTPPIKKNKIFFESGGYAAYGVGAKFTLSSNLLEDAFQIGNGGIKYTLDGLKYFTFSQQALLYGTDVRNLNYRFISVIDIPSNSHFVNHIIFINDYNKEISTHIFDIGYTKVGYSTEVLGYNYTIITGNEYIFDNWDRILFFPQYQKNGNFGVGVGGSHFEGGFKFSMYVTINDFTHVKSTISFLPEISVIF